MESKKPVSTIKKVVSTAKPGQAKTPFTGFAPASIDNTGTFKYIQIHIGSKKDPSAEKKVLIRGTKAFKYHKDILK